MSGLVSYHAGLSAEDGALRHYIDQGASLVAQRWRGQGGEIDIILRDDQGLIFVEVKASKTAARAALRISARQRVRLESAAQEFLSGEPDGLDSPCRFDVALVDGTGRVEIVENAFM